MQAFFDASTAPRTTLWEATAAPGPKLESIEGEHKVDVAVIGAGVAGLSTTLHLAEAGCSVALLEAAELGSGATGKSGGLLAPDFIRHSPLEINRLLGPDNGPRLVEMVGLSAKQCVELIETHSISCDAKLDGFWVPAHDQSTSIKLLNRANEWHEAGFNVAWIPAGETIERLGSERYCGAVRFAEGGSLNPLAFSRGLAEAAIRHGAEIYTNSPVKELTRQLDGWRLTALSGQVDAKRVVLAANGGNSALHVGMRRTALPLSVFQYATQPLAPEQKAAVFPVGGSFTDKQPYIFSARFDRDGRLISALPDFFIPRSEKSLIAEANRRLAKHFPILENASIEYLWRGTAWINPTLLPKVYDLSDGVFAIQACNGRGIALNAVLGKEMANALTKGKQYSRVVKTERPNPIKAHRLVQNLPSVLMALAYFKNRLGL
ncbi:MAG: FAD-binding oxidoreductase [Xanthomonadales bacterium]|nr:FAD-binding oxidoreductase [Xanthomonadales bacterium]